jgi:hypothetical protein
MANFYYHVIQLYGNNITPIQLNDVVIKINFWIRTLKKQKKIKKSKADFNCLIILIV